MSIFREFFNACDGIFLNYFWNYKDLKRTNEFVLKKHEDRRKDVYFGIDIFGRGQLAKFDTYKTVQKIVELKFSVSLFAPAWTYESIDFKPPPDMSKEDAMIEINKLFLERNDKFWNLLWTYLPTLGPSEFPFKTSFSIGSGLKNYKEGKSIEDKPWINMRKQNFQISVPTCEDKVCHDFSDAFDGGSCLSLTTDDLTRLFVCDIPCPNKLSFIYTFKTARNVDELSYHLKFLEKGSGKTTTVIFERVVAETPTNPKIKIYIQTVINGWVQR